MDQQHVREQFVIDDSVVSCLPVGDRAVTAQQRYREWKQSIGGASLGIEYLVPRIRKQIDGHWPPPFTSRRRGHQDLADGDLRALVDKLGPWMMPFPLAQGINTMREGTARTAARH